MSKVHPKIATTTALAALATLYAAVHSGAGSPAMIGAAVLTLVQFAAGYAVPSPPSAHPSAPAPAAGSPVRPKPPRKLPPKVRHPIRSRRRFAMFDSIEVALLPRGRGPWAVAGYVGGRWPTWADVHRLWPAHRKLSIAVGASLAAECLDVEQGDASPFQVVGWWRWMRRLGVARPCFYCNLSTVAQVIAALTRAGIRRNEYRLWIAHPDGHPHICTPGRCDPNGDYQLHTNPDATQWTFTAGGRNVDESLCEPWFL